MSGQTADPEQFLTAGALVWLVGFVVQYTRPGFAGPTPGYVYGALALLGGVLIGVGFDRLDGGAFGRR